MWKGCVSEATGEGFSEGHVGWETMTGRSCDPQVEAESGTEVGRAWQTRGTERRPVVGSTFLPRMFGQLCVPGMWRERCPHSVPASCNADANEVGVVVSDITSSSFPAVSTPWAAGPHRSSMPPPLESWMACDSFLARGRVPILWLCPCVIYISRNSSHLVFGGGGTSNGQATAHASA